MNTRLAFLALTPLLLAACRRERPVAPVAPSWLDPKVDEQGRAASQGGERVGEFFRGIAYRDDDKTDWTVALDADHCFWFTGLGDEGVEKLSLYLWNPKEKRVADKRADVPMAVMTYCPDAPGMYRLQGKVARGFGHYSVAIFQTAPVGKPPPPPEAPPEPIVDLVALIEAQALAAAPGAVRLGAWFDGKTEQTEWYAQLKAGTCYWVIGAGEPGKVKKLWLYLWDPQNRRVTESRTPSGTSMVGHCATQTGMYKFQAKLESGSGFYKFGVFQKKN
jgi:hypothetical protein